jgi:hypothetical protein
MNVGMSSTVSLPSWVDISLDDGSYHMYGRKHKN